MLATCVENVTESGREVKGYVCQSTVVPSGIRSQSVVSSLPFIIGDTLIGTDRAQHMIISINDRIRYLANFNNRIPPLYSVGF